MAKIMFFYPQALKDKPKTFFCSAVSGLCPLWTNKSTEGPEMEKAANAVDAVRANFLFHAFVKVVCLFCAIFGIFAHF